MTLFALVGSATVGAFIGSKFVTGLPEKKVQLWMGWALDHHSCFDVRSSTKVGLMF